MKNSRLILPLLFFLTLSAQAANGLLQCTDEESGQVSSKTKLLKTYTREYWQIAVSEIKSLPQTLLKAGFVAGDFHFNNAGVYYDASLNRADFQITDFDDAGKNYLIIDLFKYLTYVQKISKTINPELLLASYLEGLNKLEGDLPPEIEAVFHQSQLDFNKAGRKYIENQRQEIASFDKSQIKPEVLRLIEKLKTLKVISRLQDLDYMIQVNDSGSSMNSLRVQFIGTDSNGVTGVIEFKQLKCAATGRADFQNVSENFELVKKQILQFNPNSIIKNQFIYRYDDVHYFLVREKKKNFIRNIDLEALPEKRLTAVASYYANYLGRIHAASADVRYSDGVRTHADELIQKAKIISKKFKDEVKN